VFLVRYSKDKDFKPTKLGRKVSSYTIGTNTQGVEILDTRKLVSGLYIVEIVQEGKHVSSSKFIVQH
jgi:hypothetical protein